MSKQVVSIGNIQKSVQLPRIAEKNLWGFDLPYAQILKSTLKNRSCDPIFQGHVCKFVDSAPGCTNMQSKCRFVQEIIITRIDGVAKLGKQYFLYNKVMEESSEIERKITKIEAELVELDHRRGQLLDELTQFRRQLLQRDSPAQLLLHLQGISINNQSSQVNKIRLFRSLFKGREDVFPRRFENSRTGKSGYAPVCKSEWQSGICQKPKVSCQECNFRSFVPVCDEIIRNHLTG